MIRCLIIDDHAIVSEGLQRILEIDYRIKVVGKAATAAEGLQLTTELQPEVILLDLRLPDASGLEQIRRLKTVCPKSRVIVLTGYGSGAREEAMRLGADEFLTKELASDVITQTILSLFPEYAGPQPRPGMLSERERQLAELAARGLSNDEIADKLAISRNTVKTHLGNIFDKLGVRDRVELVVKWRELNR
ncbi:MAG TPA: response regulator transcription factor [Fimbriimonadaceae bacterium]|nr:response regulator transcription factor [Fimbriimonadaceae bacterium]